MAALIFKVAVSLRLHKQTPISLSTQLHANFFKILTLYLSSFKELK